MKNIKLNFNRLQDKEYSLENIFKPADYEWPGDWEGRALLAFLCHYEIDKSEINHLHKFVKDIPQKANEHFYFGRKFDGKIVDEQQLSGHNWYLRGLLKYSKLFGDDFALKMAKSTVDNLYLPTLKWFTNYPLKRQSFDGDVCGNIDSTADGWKLSTDIGCAFMCVDGLSHYYRETKDEQVKAFLDKLIDIFIKIDLIKYNLQTHCTLSCLRGILLLYQTTLDEKYLNIVKEKFDFYQANGMTLTYENFNWFGKKDTWTEPCAVVDSLILSTELYHLTKEQTYRTLARRIWFNGLQFCQRENGGVGPNSCTHEKQNILKILLYEATFCCTMRYAEGLLQYHKNKDLFTWDKGAPVISDVYGRRFIDDMLLVNNGDNITTIFSCNDIDKEQTLKLELRIY